VHGRRFMLCAQAIELFFADGVELFLNFSGGTRERDRFYAKLRNSCKVRSCVTSRDRLYVLFSNEIPTCIGTSVVVTEITEPSGCV
jgi:hypothetical protein